MIVQPHLTRRKLMKRLGTAPLLASGVGATLAHAAGSPSGLNGKSPVIENYLTPRLFEVPMSGGRTIRGYDIGPPDVPVVIGLHGGSSTAVLGDIASYMMSAPIFCRLITFDRQGYGATTPQPGRRVSDIVPLVEAVLDYLSVDVAAVFGSSAGGPPALATAALLPKRVSRAASLCGVGPSYGPGGFDYAEGATPPTKEEIVEARRGSEASRKVFRRFGTGYYRTEDTWSANDLRLKLIYAPLVENVKKQLKIEQSSFPPENAYVDEVQSWVKPWGFDLASISVPTRFFHGMDDVMVPPRHSQWLQSQIPNASLELFSHFGHNLKPLWPHVFAWLVADLRSHIR